MLSSCSGVPSADSATAIPPASIIFVLLGFALRSVYREPIIGDLIQIFIGTLFSLRTKAAVLSMNRDVHLTIGCRMSSTVVDQGNVAYSFLDRGEWSTLLIG